MKKDLKLILKQQLVLNTQNNKKLKFLYPLLLSIIVLVMLFLSENTIRTKIPITYNCEYLGSKYFHLVLSFFLLVCICYLYIDLLNTKPDSKSNTTIFFSLCLSSSIFHIAHRLYGDCILDYLNFFNLFWFNISDILINVGFIGIIILYFRKK